MRRILDKTTVVPRPGLPLLRAHQVMSSNLMLPGLNLPKRTGAIREVREWKEYGFWNQRDRSMPLGFYDLGEIHNSLSSQEHKTKYPSSSLRRNKWDDGLMAVKMLRRSYLLYYNGFPPFLPSLLSFPICLMSIDRAGICVFS